MGKVLGRILPRSQPQHDAPGLPAICPSCIQTHAACMGDRIGSVKANAQHTRHASTKVTAAGTHFHLYPCVHLPPTPLLYALSTLPCIHASEQIWHYALYKVICILRGSNNVTKVALQTKLPHTEHAQHTYVVSFTCLLSHPPVENIRPSCRTDTSH